MTVIGLKSALHRNIKCYRSREKTVKLPPFGFRSAGLRSGDPGRMLESPAPQTIDVATQEQESFPQVWKKLWKTKGF